MTDKCDLCLLGLIILCSLVTGTGGVDDAHVFISSGENVRLPCNNALSDCKSTTWIYGTSRHSEAAELTFLGIKNKNTGRHERLSLGSDCSLNIKNITKEDYGFYTCRHYVNGEKQGTDARVFLHVLHVIVIAIVAASFVVLLLALILWMIREKRAEEETKSAGYPQFTMGIFLTPVYPESLQAEERLCRLRQSGRPLERYVEEFLEVCYLVSWTDASLNAVFLMCMGKNSFFLNTKALFNIFNNAV
ncbi:hypothetical protein DPX16_3110 [Anabarilius grahami]|uniref:Ig-like domain-containing protein n=1 Tax=Anabarilius grahami TaxID=495550 RepID=A0A3N0XSB2_ANAGA|nr:hypothetical protein DPX16_3110 [Anabarilius grahami]